MAKSIGSVAAVLSLNTGQFTARLADASSQLRNFGRSVSSAFGKSLPDMSLPVFGGQGLTASQKELAAINDAAILAQRNLSKASGALHFGKADHGIKALSGSLFLLTGQTGFFVVEAARAASHVSKWAQEAGGLSGAMSVAGAAANSLLGPLGPLGAAILGIGAAWASVSAIMERANGETEKANKLASEGLPIYAKELETLDRLRVATGELTEFEARRKAEERRLGRGMNDGERASLVSTLAAEEDMKRLAFGKQEDARAFQHKAKLAAEFAANQKKLDEDNRKKIEEAAKAQLDSDWDRAIRLDRIEEERRKKVEDMAKSALIGAGAARASQFQADPAMRVLGDFQERIDALKNSGDKIGADFGISSGTFRDAPIGSVIGPQREQSKTNEHLEDIKELQQRLVTYIEENGLGLTIGS